MTANRHYQARLAFQARFAIRDRSHSGAVATVGAGGLATPPCFDSGVGAAKQRRRLFLVWERSLTANRRCQARLAFQARFAIRDRSHSGAVATVGAGGLATPPYFDSGVGAAKQRRHLFLVWERSLTANRRCQARLAFQARFAIRDRSTAAL
ncbi:hypothetical protein CEK62_04465 [Alcanivorax sp. N3-2A]|nr:hypothetical protein CEK62_04465 [Alcanivorax sp. N3-2A]